MEVVIASLKDLDRAVDMAYEMQGHIRTRCRPLLIDASREQIYDRFRRYIVSDEHEILLVMEGEKLQGLTPINFIEKDLYISYTQGPYAYNYEIVSNCLYDYISDRFRGYKLYVNTARDHIDSISFFKSKGFNTVEEAVLLRLEKLSFHKLDQSIEAINDSNCHLIYNWIDKHIDEDTYWNPKRIRQNLNRFIILGYFDEGMQGHIIGRGAKDYTEIIALSGQEIIKEKLLRGLISKSYEHGIKKIDLYTEDDFEAALGKKYDFQLYDSNICFIKALIDL